MYDYRARLLRTDYDVFVFTLAAGTGNDAAAAFAVAIRSSMSHSSASEVTSSSSSLLLSESPLVPSFLRFMMPLFFRRTTMQQLRQQKTIRPTTMSSRIQFAGAGRLMIHL
jgi:hypothetical protein